MQWDYVYSAKKNNWLQEHRGIGFEDVIELIAQGKLLGVINHPNPGKYPDQKIYLVDIDGYIWMVPFEKQDGVIALKTAYPSRKATKRNRE